MLMWATVCFRLRIRDRAGELYELLAPFSGQFVAGGTLVSGSTAWALGQLAATLESYEDAERHFAAAAELEARLGARLFLARTRCDWAHALIARGLPEDLDRARLMLEQAEETADQLGAKGISRGVAECRDALATVSGWSTLRTSARRGSARSCRWG